MLLAKTRRGRLKQAEARNANIYVCRNSTRRQACRACGTIITLVTDPTEPAKKAKRGLQNGFRPTARVAVNPQDFARFVLAKKRICRPLFGLGTRKPFSTKEHGWELYGTLEGIWPGWVCVAYGSVASKKNTDVGRHDTAFR